MSYINIIYNNNLLKEKIQVIISLITSMADHTIQRLLLTVFSSHHGGYLSEELSQHYTECWSTGKIHGKGRNKMRKSALTQCHVSALPCSHILATPRRKERYVNCINTGKEEIKCFLYWDNKTILILCKVIHKYCKVSVNIPTACILKVVWKNDWISNTNADNRGEALRGFSGRFCTLTIPGCLQLCRAHRSTYTCKGVSLHPQEKDRLVGNALWQATNHLRGK